MIDKPVCKKCGKEVTIAMYVCDDVSTSAHPFCSRIDDKQFCSYCQEINGIKWIEKEKCLS